MGARWAEKVDQLGPGWRALGVGRLAAVIAASEYEVLAWSPSVVDGWGLKGAACLLAATTKGLVIAAPDGKVRLAEWSLVERVTCQVEPPTLTIGGVGFCVVLRRGPHHLMAEIAHVARTYAGLLPERV